MQAFLAQREKALALRGVWERVWVRMGCPPELASIALERLDGRGTKWPKAVFRAPGHWSWYAPWVVDLERTFRRVLGYTPMVIFGSGRFALHPLDQPTS